jgi:putative acetyltransferase
VVTVRRETESDRDAIRHVNVAAFRDHPFSQQTEHLIVDALRAAGALTVSLVAELDGQVVGHIAFSPARIGDASSNWYLLGPVAVHPDHQRRGIGRGLIERGLSSLRALGGRGCVLVGDPAFYRPFGFRPVRGVTCPGVPDENVLCLPLCDETPAGEVLHHAAFSVRP